MLWERFEEQLTQILQTPVRRHRMTVSEWEAMAHERPGEQGQSWSAAQEGIVYFRLGMRDTTMLEVLSVEEVLITPSEKRLVEMLLEVGAGFKRSQASAVVGEDERKASAVRDWLVRMLEDGEMQADMPELLATPLHLYEARIPFLLYGGYSDNRSVSYKEFKRLLESFFEVELVLIPLMEKEWLILGPVSLLSAGGVDEREEGEEETPEEALASLGSGLYAMLENEWVGECHLTLQEAMIPATSLLSAVQQMRETIMLGKRYHVGSNLHFPWALHMETLLVSVPEPSKAHFVEQVLSGIEQSLDAETISTLDQFFELECNVSETAKHLYIHRNTLLYRLDKFKQETGRDVRSFNDAVLVKTALLLYKVTKRK